MVVYDIDKDVDKSFSVMVNFDHKDYFINNLLITYKYLTIIIYNINFTAWRKELFFRF